MEIEKRGSLHDAIASTIGNVLEWYDFVMFGLMAVLISKQFFSADDPYVALLATTATFGAGFIFRPLGGVLIGMYADRKGRKSALMLVIVLMTIATSILAFTPSYSQIGVTATVLAVLARLLQGVSAGGEFGTATSMVIEYAPANREGLYGSLQMVAQSCGALLAALIGALLTNLFSPEAIASWAWRLPFLFGLIIGPLGLYMRRNMKEPEAFTTAKRSEKVALRPILKAYAREITLATALSATLNVMSAVIVAYLPIYAVHTLGLPASVPFDVLVVVLLLRQILIPCFGHLTDKIGGEIILLYSLIGLLLALYPCYYWIVHYPSMTSVMGGSIILAIFMGAFQGAISTVSARLFPPEVRATGLSLAYNIGAALLGGLSPFAVTWLLDVTKDRYMPAHYCALFFIIGIVSSCMIKKTSGVSCNLIASAKPVELTK